MKASLISIKVVIFATTLIDVALTEVEVVVLHLCVNIKLNTKVPDPNIKQFCVSNASENKSSYVFNDNMLSRKQSTLVRYTKCS